MCSTQTYSNTHDSPAVGGYTVARNKNKFFFVFATLPFNTNAWKRNKRSHPCTSYLCLRSVNHGTTVQSNVPWCIHEFGIFRHKNVKMDKRTHLKTFIYMMEYIRKVMEWQDTLPTKWVWYVAQRKQKFTHNFSKET